RDAVTKKPLARAEFLVRDSEGRAVGPNNGRYITGADGTAIVTGLEPNATILVSESKAPTGYILDEMPKTIVVRSGAANSLIFDDEPGTTLIIKKFIEGTENEPLSGVAFRVVDGSGAAVGPDDGIYYTDHAGEIVLSGIEPGTTVTAREIKTVEGFVLDGTPQDILIKAGEKQQLTFWNKRAGTLVIQKKDKVTGEFIPGAQFQLTYANGGYVDNDNGHLSSNGLYTTDDKGEIRVNGITGTVVVKEVKAAPGYVIDQSTQTQTVTVNPLDTQTLTFLNEPLCSLTITKVDSVTGKPVPGTEFTVRDGNGSMIGKFTTGKDGTVTVTGLVPGSTVVVTETKVPKGYVLNPTPQTIVVKNGTGNVLTSGSSSSGSSGDSSSSGNSGGNNLDFENDPTTILTIQKFVEGTANEPLKGVEFLVTDSRNAVVGPNNGYYTTDKDGRITIPNLEPGTVITARETRTLDGYILDSSPQSIEIKVGDGQTLTFWNARFVP
uniref:SpaA isopeptide-forming pilin-related protein n=1 Tax=Faecalibaculum rodentium TaxID=1702221 RepID=UPI0023F336CA